MKNNTSSPNHIDFSHLAVNTPNARSFRGMVSRILCFALGISSLALATVSARAGTVCLAETESGKMVKLEITSVGTMGAFQHAELTITDKDGRKIFSKIYKEPAQYADTIHQGKSVVVFSSMSGEADVSLVFIGKDEDEHDEAKLLSILRDPKRERAKGNRMTVSVYEEGKAGEFRFKDLVVSVEKDL